MGGRRLYWLVKCPHCAGAFRRTDFGAPTEDSAHKPNEVPKEKHGAYSLRGILAQIGISKSSYYQAINSERYGSHAFQQETNRQKDIEDIQKVLDKLHIMLQARKEMV